MQLSEKMEVIRGIIPQRSLSFYNEAEGRFQSDIWDELCAGLWKKYSIENRITNDALGEMRQTEWNPVFPNKYRRCQVLLMTLQQDK